MPNCIDCIHLDPTVPQCKLAPLGGTKGRVKACEIAVLKKHQPNFRGDILEVGCGIFKGPKKAVLAQGCKYYGLDPRWPDNPSMNFFNGSAAHIPFESETFDWVLAFSSIEHWDEKGDSIENGLSEIHRVLKPGGYLLVAAPIHNHGHNIFYYGSLGVIRDLFNDGDWAEVDFELWGRNSSPLPPIKEWMHEKHRIDSLLKSTSGREPETYTIEVLCQK